MNNMNFKIEDKDVELLGTMDIQDRDDNGRWYVLNNVRILKNSFRMTFDTYKRIRPLGLMALDVYFAIIEKLHTNTNVVVVDRKYLKKYTKASDASVSRAVHSLLNVGVIECIAKDTYAIPIYTAYKGSLPNILKKDREEKEFDKENRLHDENLNKFVENNNHCIRKRKSKSKTDDSKSKEVNS